MVTALSPCQRLFSLRLHKSAGRPDGGRVFVRKGLQHGDVSLLQIWQDAKIPVLSTLGMWHLFWGVSDGSPLTTGGDDKMRDPAGMTGKGMKALKRTGAEDRTIF
jgi:hypothetical protein